jgi:hypothetical protein
MKLANKLTTEINTYNTPTPNVEMFITSESIYWVTQDTEFVWIADHRDISEYIDKDHRLQEFTGLPEGVSSPGVFWMNEDFENPFHISDFTAQIETITV